MGKSTNYIWPMVIFNSYVTNYQRVVMLRFYACDQPSVEAGVESPATCWTCNQQLPLHVDSLPRHFEFWSVRTLAGSCARTLCYAMLCYDYEIFSRACAPTWSKPHLTHSSDFALSVPHQTWQWTFSNSRTSWSWNCQTCHTPLVFNWSAHSNMTMTMTMTMTCLDLKKRGVTSETSPITHRPSQIHTWIISDQRDQCTRLNPCFWGLCLDWGYLCLIREHPGNPGFDIKNASMFLSM